MSNLVQGTMNLWHETQRALQMPYSSDGGVYYAPEEGFYTGPPDLDKADIDAVNSIDANDEAVAILIYVVCAVVILLGLVYVVYAVARGRWCPCFSRDSSDSDTLDRGPLAEKAAMHGLSKDERSILIKHIFSTRTRAWNGMPVSVGQELVLTGDKQDLEQGNRKSDQLQVLETASAGAKPGISEKTADHERLCCICLVEYEPDCQVLSGSSCDHLIHATCGMEWMNSAHDHCPYCRKEMMTPQEYRKAATAALSATRVATFDPFIDEMKSLTYNHNPPLSVATSDESDLEAGNGRGEANLRGWTM